MITLPGIVSYQPFFFNFFDSKFICEPLSALPYHKHMACVLHDTPGKMSLLYQSGIKNRLHLQYEKNAWDNGAPITYNVISGQSSKVNNEKGNLAN